MSDGLGRMDGWCVYSKFRLWVGNLILWIHLIHCTKYTHNDLIESLKSDSKIDVDDADAEADEGDGSGTIDIIQLHRSQIAISAEFPFVGFLNSKWCNTWMPFLHHEFCEWIAFAVSEIKAKHRNHFLFYSVFFSLSLLAVLSRIILSNYYKHLSRERSASCFITKWMMTLRSAICHGSYYIIRNFIQVDQDPSNQAPSRVKCELLKAPYHHFISSKIHNVNTNCWWYQTRRALW